ncbi:MAG: 30S ribosomal protein S13 [Dehalococcoidales bacterium]|jgi:small subunit ribosomal protein S13|nr:30S ribosomal protein S13 [Dehalococcoidia bacterium]NCG35833.1 30S ribosomal protein S13 [Dehalococcoidales bacterium]
MAMLAGVNIPDSQRIEIALTAVSGIGRATSKKIISDVGINLNTRVKDLEEEELARIRSAIDRSQIRIEGDLKREVQLNIRRLSDVGSYRGLRHKNGLPANGQRTKTNARTRKGKKKTIANKKKLTH